MKALATIAVDEAREFTREVVGPPLRFVTGILRAVIPNARSNQIKA